jgi:hypothetical protein
MMARGQDDGKGASMARDRWQGIAREHQWQGRAGGRASVTCAICRMLYAKCHMPYAECHMPNATPGEQLHHARCHIPVHVRVAGTQFMHDYSLLTHAYTHGNADAMGRV